MENITAAEKNKSALKYGLLIGLIYIVISCVVNLFMTSMIAYYGLKLIGYILLFVLVGVFASRIRKDNGGYIEFKEIFGAIFIMVLIVAVMSYVYNYINMFIIDPHYLDKMKAMSLDYMNKMKLPDEKMDEITRDTDKRIEESKHFSLGKNLLNLAMAIVIDSLFGLIVALIVRKSRPVYQA